MAKPQKIPSLEELESANKIPSLDELEGLKKKDISEDVNEQSDPLLGLSDTPKSQSNGVVSKAVTAEGEPGVSEPAAQTTTTKIGNPTAPDMLARKVEVENDEGIKYDVWNQATLDGSLKKGFHIIYNGKLPLPPPTNPPKFDTKIKGLPDQFKIPVEDLPLQRKKELAYEQVTKNPLVAEQILKTLPDTDSYKHELSANLMLQNGDKAGAVTALEQAKKLNPNNPRLYLQSAQVFAQRGDESNTIANATKYLNMTEGDWKDNEEIAQNRATAYQLLGNPEKATYWNMTANDIKADKTQNAYAKTIQGLPDKVYENLQIMYAPAELMIEGTKKFAQAEIGALQGENILTETLPKIGSAMIDQAFGAMMSTPAGMAFNSALVGANLIGANQATEWVFSPVSKMLADSGVDESKFSEWGKVGVQTLNVGISLLFLHGAKSGSKKIMDIAEKLRTKQPVTPEELKVATEVVAEEATTNKSNPLFQKRIDVIEKARENELNSIKESQFEKKNSKSRFYSSTDEFGRTREEVVEKVNARYDELINRIPQSVIPEVIKTIDDAVTEQKTTEGLKKVQDELSQDGTPSYRVDSEMAQNPQEVVERVKAKRERKKKAGVKPQDETPIEIDIRNDKAGEQMVAEQVIEPVEKVEPALPVEEKPIETPISKEPPPLSEGLYKSKNEEIRAYHIAQGFIWDGEKWVHPDYPGKSVYSSDVPPPKKENVLRELAKIRGEKQSESIVNINELKQSAQINKGDIVTFTEPAIVYKNGKPTTIQSKKAGTIEEIKQNGDVGIKKQDGGYITLKQEDISVPEPVKSEPQVEEQPYSSGTEFDTRINEIRSQMNNMKAGDKGYAELDAELTTLLAKSTEMGNGEPTDLIQREKYDCGASALRSVLIGKGDLVTENEMIKETGSNDKVGTQIGKIVEVAENHGLKAESREGMTAKDIETELTNGNEIILLQEGVGGTKKGNDYSGTKDGHYITVKSADGKKITFEDPATKGTEEMTYSDLEKRWHGLKDDNKTIAKGQAIVIKGKEKLINKGENKENSSYISGVKTELTLDTKSTKSTVRYTDNNGNTWEAKATNKSKTGNYDIYKNGEIINDIGAKTKADIKQSIELIIERENVPELTTLSPAKKQNMWEKAGSNSERIDVDNYRIYVRPNYTKNARAGTVDSYTVQVYKMSLNGSQELILSKPGFKRIAQAKADINSTFNDFRNKYESKNKVEPIKEGVQDASEIRKGTESGSEPKAPELVTGEEGRIHLRDNEKNGVETQAGKETPQPATEVNPDIKQKAQTLAEKIRSFKIQEGLKPTETQGISDTQLWNDALESIAKVVEESGNVAQAITEWAGKFKMGDKEKFIGFMNDNFKDEIKITEPASEGLKKLDSIREEYGLSEYTKEPVADPEINAQAQKLIDDGINVQSLINKAKENGTLNTVEQTVMAKVIEAMRVTAQTPTELKLFADMVETLSRVRSESGRQLRHGQIFTDAETSFADMVAEDMFTSKVDKLTPEQIKANQSEFDRISETKAKLEQHVSKLETENLKLRAEQNLRQIVKESAPKRSIRMETLKDRRERLAKEQNDLFAQLRAEKDKPSITQMGYGFTLAEEKIILKIAKNFFDQKVTDVELIAQKIYDGVKDKFVGVAKTDILNIMAGGTTNEKAPTKNLLMEMKKDLEDAEKLVSDLEKETSSPDPTTETGKTKKNQKIKKTSDSVKFNKESAEERRERETVERLQKELDDLEAGIVKEPKKRTPETSQQIKDLRKQIKEHDLKRLAQKKASIRREIDKVNNQIATGQYRPPKPKPVPLDAEGQKLMDELTAVRNERKLRLARQQYLSRSLPQKIQDFVISGLGVPRAIVASMDLSASLLQAGFVATSHPFVWGRALSGSIRDMVSEKGYLRFMEEQKADRRYDIATKSGVAITDPKSTDITLQEELFMGNIAEKIPFLGRAVGKIPFTGGKIMGTKDIVIGGKQRKVGGLLSASSRVYSSMLNRIRLESAYKFIDAFESQGKTADNSPHLYKEMARYVNATTGRGDLFRAENSARILGTALWSPRLYSAQIQLLTGRPLWMSPKEIKQAYVYDWAKYIGATGAMLLLAKACGGDIDKDPRSKNFWTIGIGNTRIGLPGGFAQYVILGSQLLSGKEKSLFTGELRKLEPGFQKKTRADVFLRWGRGKLAPLLAFGADLLYGETYMGDEVTIPTELQHYFVPLSIGSGIQTGEYESVQKGILDGALSMTGINIRSMAETGWFPKQVITYKGKETNALGESPKNVDKEIWDNLKKYKINIEPTPRYKVTGLYDPKKNEDVKPTDEQYFNFVQYRGEMIKEMTPQVIAEIDNNREKYIDEIMALKYFDGTPVQIDRKIAGEILDKVFIPNVFENNISNIEDVAKQKIILENPYTLSAKPPGMYIKVIDKINELKEKYGTNK